MSEQKKPRLKLLEKPKGASVREFAKRYFDLIGSVRQPEQTPPPLPKK
jgi:hypothetical protein